MSRALELERRPEDSLPHESRLFGDTLRGFVRNVGPKLDPPEPFFDKGPASHEPKRTSPPPAPPRLPFPPVADLADPAVEIADADRPEELAARLVHDCKALLLVRREPCAGIGFRVCDGTAV